MSFIQDFLRYNVKNVQKLSETSGETGSEDDASGDSDSGSGVFPDPARAISYVPLSESELITGLKREDGFMDLEEDVQGEIQYGHDIRAAVALFWQTMMPKAVLERINRTRHNADLPDIEETIELLPPGEERSDIEPVQLIEDRRKQPRPDTPRHDQN